MTDHPAVEFLRKKHTRMEMVAGSLPRGPWGWVHHSPPDSYQTLEGPSGWFVLRTQSQPGTTSKLERHAAFDEYLPDPEEVLLRIEAEREILAEHALDCTTDGQDCRTCSVVEPGFSSSWPASWPCKTVLALAKGWGWKELCGETTVFWPEAEHCEAQCMLPADHKGPHEDESLGTWS